MKDITNTSLVCAIDSLYMYGPISRAFSVKCFGHTYDFKLQMRVIISTEIVNSFKNLQEKN